LPNGAAPADVPVFATDGVAMVFLQRLVIAMLAGVAFSLVLHLGAQLLLGVALPPGLSGAAGGIAAVVVWAQFRRRGERRPGDPA
jgi:hypothetical protein